MTTFQYYSRLLKPYRWKYALAMVGVLINISDMVVPMFISVSIDAASLKKPDASHIILSALLWVVGIAVVRTFTFVASRYVIVGVSRHTAYDLRNIIYDKLLRLSDRFFVGMSTGEIMNRASSDVQSVTMFLGMGGNLFPNAVLRTILGTILMISISWKLAIPVLLFVPALFFIEYLFGRKIFKLYRVVQDYNDKVVSRVQENYSGARTIRSYNQEDHEKRMYKGMMDKYVQTIRPLNIMDALFWPILNMASWTPILIILWYGGVLYIQGQITLGGLSAFIAYVSLMIWPIISLGWVTNLYQRSNASLKRIVEITEAVPDIKSPPNPCRPKTVDGTIELKDVKLSYGTETNSIDGISIVIPKGQVVGVVGPVGSGKSSFGKLLLRVWDPDSGEISIDGVDIKKWDLKMLRKSFGYVPQDNFLFSASIGENIAFAKPDATREEIEKVAEMVQIRDEIEKFPEGFGTVVGERGVTLSGGQRQRVAIARALLLDPPMMLLDDPLSAVDTSTEDTIIDTLEPIIKGRTTIIIAHRVSAMRLADRIIVLDKGRVVEDGTHQELMAKGGYYADLVEKQRLATQIGQEGTDA